MLGLGANVGLGPWVKPVGEPRRFEVEGEADVKG
jgi:hypothetical protein